MWLTTDLTYSFQPYPSLVWIIEVWTHCYFIEQQERKAFRASVGPMIWRFGGGQMTSLLHLFTLWSDGYCFFIHALDLWAQGQPLRWRKRRDQLLSALDMTGPDMQWEPWRHCCTTGKQSLKNSLCIQREEGPERLVTLPEVIQHLKVMLHWRREEKVTTEDELVGWHHRRDGREFE